MEIDFDHYIKIYLDDEHEPAETIQEVLRLVRRIPKWGISSLGDCQ